MGKDVSSASLVRLTPNGRNLAKTILTDLVMNYVYIAGKITVFLVLWYSYQNNLELSRMTEPHDSKATNCYLVMLWLWKVLVYYCYRCILQENVKVAPFQLWQWKIKRMNFKIWDGFMDHYSPFVLYYFFLLYMEFE